MLCVYHLPTYNKYTEGHSSTLLFSVTRARVLAPSPHPPPPLIAYFDNCQGRLPMERRVWARRLMPEPEWLRNRVLCWQLTGIRNIMLKMGRILFFIIFSYVGFSTWKKWKHYENDFTEWRDEVWLDSTRVVLLNCADSGRWHIITVVGII